MRDLSKILIVVMLSVGLVSCTSGANAPAGTKTESKSAFTGKLTLNYKEGGQEFSKNAEIKQGMVVDLKVPSRMGGAEVNGTTYEIFVGNYEFKPMANLDRQPKSDGQIAVKFEIVAEKGQPIKPGNYPAASPKDGANIVGKTRSAYLTIFEAGKPKSLGMTADYPRGERKGFVRIDSVDGGMVKGEIDLSDDAYAVKGPFTAQVTSN